MHWNTSSSHGTGWIQGTSTRKFQINTIEAAVLDCVPWDAVTSTAGTEVTYVLIPDALVGLDYYTEGDIVTANRLYQGTPATLDDSTNVTCFWQDTSFTFSSITGIQGYTGIQGLTGAQGLTGHLGAQGIPGSIWFDDTVDPPDNTVGGFADNWLNTITYDIWYKRVDGWHKVGNIAGGLGATGVDGVTGLVGLTGAQGYTGLQGITGLGITGIQGVTGLQGLTGVGIQGATGVGSMGIQGATGVAGLDAEDGATGVAGVTGLQGITGVGTTGVQGQTGIIGLTGAQGYTGLQGVTGLRGVTGLVGVTGLRGITGVGATGVTGVTGPLFAVYS